MAKSENNLTAVFTDTANAIRSKTGQSAQISPRDFADQISTIEVSPKSEYKEMFIDLLQNATVSITIPDDVTWLGKYRWYEDANLTYIDFNKVESIPPYTCRDCTNLTQVVFSTNTTEIDEYAFYGCTQLENTELPHTLTNIGQLAFYNVGSAYARGTHTFALINDVGVYTTIGKSAFASSHLSKIDAYANDIDESAFSSCSSLTDVDIEIHGSVGSSIFSTCEYVENFKIDPNSVITSLGSTVFYHLAYNIPVTSLNISPFDFRNSTFTTLNYGVWRYNKYDGIVYFPSTLSTISNNFLIDATGNWKLYFSSIPTVSSSSYIRSNSGTAFTVKYCFLPELIEQAKQKTNWSSHTAQMAAWVDGIPTGEEIQPYTKDNGYAITWYSDTAMTQIATTSAGPTTVYYGEVTGSTREAWYVNKKLLDASVTISDGSVTYGNFVPINATVTITPSYTDPTKNQLYKLKVNGVDYTSVGTATIQATEDISIVALYWNGIDYPFMPTMSDNDWDMIKLASKVNTIPASWQVGDTKTFIYDGVEYAARLVDKTGKFTRVADGSTAYLYFETTETLPNFEYYHSHNNNIPTLSELLAKMTSGTIWDKVDPLLQSVLEDVNVKVSQGGGSSTQDTIINWTGKLFLPREHDLFSTRVYSVQNEWDAIMQDQYYQANDTDDARKKKSKSSSSSIAYWEMSPYAGSSSFVCLVWSSGKSSYNNPSSGEYASLRFAL